MSNQPDQAFETRSFEDFIPELRTRGWSILRPDAIDANPADTLSRIGRLVPQYNGQITFDVTYKKGFDDAPYSQSMNGLGAHTEAPGYEPPPKYLALYCHRQARCGKGQTLLADGVQFYDHALDADLRAWADENEVEFVAAAKPGDTERRSFRAKIRGEAADAPVMRFSYNLFRYGNVNPNAEDVANADRIKNTPLSRIAEQGEAWFAQNLTPVLIPDGCMMVWDNHRLIHGRGEYADPGRHLTRYWIS
ncbi:TauD/TfdA family dioxygenase [Rhizobium sp. FKY42]|uniref:TauD/TfdA family dioxygenase n=1 Tax=Rhizobium sp. FKY42 TaxID=2562310 RepID=UPI0010BFC189|nr:TauD/TfdA family dioxygenase [Rhizobium sp. FKY42]